MRQWLLFLVFLNFVSLLSDLKDPIEVWDSDSGTLRAEMKYKHLAPQRQKAPLSKKTCSEFCLFCNEQNTFDHLVLATRPDTTAQDRDH